MSPGTPLGQSTIWNLPDIREVAVIASRIGISPLAGPPALAVKGTVRTCRRGVVAFYVPGEIFGWSGDPTHSLSAEAATDTLIFFLKRSSLYSAASQNSRMQVTPSILPIIWS